MSARADAKALASRLWASRWPEVGWGAFAVGCVASMVLVPSWSMLPFHLTWISLLLLYVVGHRTASRALTWLLLAPSLAETVLIFLDERIRTLASYDELIEAPVIVVLLFAITRLTGRRKAAMAALHEVSQQNLDLLQRQRAFIQNASHELRTPITVALAHAELLAMSAADTTAASTDGAPDSVIVIDELERLRRLVDRLVLLATAEQPDLAQPSPTSLAPLAEDVLRRWEPVARRWVDGGRDDVTVFADPDRLMVALDSLLDNAVRFTRESDSIEVSVRSYGGQAAVTVADSGPGIPDAQLESVFDRFNGSGPQRDSAHNFGLGLAIVRAIAEAHGGRVMAERSRDGGAAVTMWLPLYQPAGRVATSPLPA